ncbi:hypothetical protein [Aeromicrobium sp. 9AM]|uniref:gp53-like domain-containing protein n=1 Tax=Aeromicrobium sp. 9AM TaxID=2653126 RepID=UPI0012F013E6|nr:hypothetical protein [Aeromicrobium sp. 9AM]VXB81662.1 hypothetical protein AERO9AM_20975 [Aeromicrobium sp. 9AM]
MPYPFTDLDPLTPLEDILNEVVEAAAAMNQRGAGTLATSGTGTPAAPVTNSATVTFPTAFPPGTDVVVTCSATGTSNVGNRFALAASASETGFTVRVGSTSGTGQTVSYSWTAGPKSV